MQYDYDALNRMTVARENGTFILANYIYDTLSRRTSLVYGNGASQGYVYNDPTNQTDPTGNCGTICIGAVVGFVAEVAVQAYTGELQAAVSSAVNDGDYSALGASAAKIGVSTVAGAATGG